MSLFMTPLRSRLLCPEGPPLQPTVSQRLQVPPWGNLDGTPCLNPAESRLLGLWGKIYPAGLVMQG